MPQTLIEAFPNFKRPEPEKSVPFIRVAEFFTDTLQGENLMGYPATFLRVQDCTQSCIWCDTKSVWMQGNPYIQEELIDLIERFDLIEKFRNGQHLVLTGGSPLRQQEQLVRLIELFIARFEFKPYIEVENECTLMPNAQMIKLVDCWNNSPKLASSGNPKSLRYQPSILKTLAGLHSSWFKFVVGDDEDWEEIQTDFLDTNLIGKHQIILMPLGADRDELDKTREVAANMAIKYGVRFSDRLHITIWNKATGV